MLFVGVMDLLFCWIRKIVPRQSKFLTWAILLTDSPIVHVAISNNTFAICSISKHYFSEPDAPSWVFVTLFYPAHHFVTKSATGVPWHFKVPYLDLQCILSLSSKDRMKDVKFSIDEGSKYQIYTRVQIDFLSHHLILCIRRYFISAIAQFWSDFSQFDFQLYFNLFVDTAFFLSSSVLDFRNLVFFFSDGINFPSPTWSKSRYFSGL